MNVNERFKALSDPTRRKILDLLKEKSLTASEIAELCDSTKPNISQHLNVLKDCGLITGEKRGTYIHFSLNPFDYHEAKGEVRKLLSIKDKILFDIKSLVEEKKCEPVMGTDSQDDGYFYVMKDSKTLLSFSYSFRLSSFIVSFEIPSKVEQFQIGYTEHEKIDELYEFVKNELSVFVEKEEKNKEQIEVMERELTDMLDIKISDMDLFMTKDQKILKQIKEWSKDFILMNYPSVFENEMKLYQFLEEKMLEITSLGILHDLMIDDSVSEIMVNGSDEVWMEKDGRLIRTDIKFKNNEELYDLTKKIVKNLGRRLDKTNPIVNAKLQDGSEILIVLPPISVKGVSITIRKYSGDSLNMEDFIIFHSMTEEMATFLKCAVKSRANIVVSGDSGTGKTTLLNILANEIPVKERVVTVEDTLELKLNEQHVVKLETRIANPEGLGEITITDCIKTARKMRPERLIVGEIRDGAMFHLAQMMNAGHDGTMTSIYANSPNDCAEKMKKLIVYAGYDLPNKTIGEMIADAIDIIIQVTRLKDGTKKITQIAEVVDYDDELERFILEPIFIWEPMNQTGVRLEGEFIYSGYGYSKDFSLKIERYGYEEELNSKMPKTSLDLVEGFQRNLFDIPELLADCLKSGHQIKNSIKMVSEYIKEPFVTEFKKIIVDVDTGLTLTRALTNSKDRVNDKDYGLMMNAIISQTETGGPLENVLRHVAIIFEHRLQFKNIIPKIHQKKIMNSREWQVMEYLDFLSIVVPNAKDLESAIMIANKYVNNFFRTEMILVIEQIKAGKRLKDALIDVAKYLKMPEVDSFVSQINQSIAFGTNIEKTLAMQADKMRKLQLMLLEMKRKRARFLLGFI